MSLSVILTSEEALLSGPVRMALREGIAQCGSATLLVPGFGQALDAQRTLAGEPGLSLAVSTTTPSSWARERWEVWGDGRICAKADVLTVLAREALQRMAPEDRAPLELSQGLMEVLGQLVGQWGPWLPLDQENRVQVSVCEEAGLTQAETRLMGLAGSLRALLAERGFVGAADVMAAVPAILREEHAAVPPVVLAGFTQMPRAQRELVRALSELTQVTFVGFAPEGAAAAQVRSLAESLGAPVVERDVSDDAPLLPRVRGLKSLLAALFGGGCLEPSAEEPVELLLAAGPVAEAELIARTVERLCATSERASVVVAVPNVQRARRELMPKLAARGIPVRFHGSRGMLDCPSAQAFFAFAHTVAHLVELDATWPEPAAGLEGPVPQLGDMSWWPPRELADFLLSDISHSGVELGWRNDTRWRGNRLLTPGRVLEQLQSGRDTSDAVAQATRELLRGRIGTAASKLLAPYVMPSEGAGEEEGESPAPAKHNDEAQAVLQGVLALAGSLRELGVTADPTAEHHIGLSELVTLCEWAALGMSVVERTAVQADAGGPHVALMSVSEAAALAPASVDALVVCGMTTAEQPVGASDGLVDSVLAQLGVEPRTDPMARARASFRALAGVPRERLVLERALHDADAKEAYPSVMLSELLAAYGIPAGAKPAQIPLAVQTRGETLLAENLSATDAPPARVAVSHPAPSGQLTNQARELVFVPQDGSDRLAGGKPLLSASQVETYLDCPYKWFSLRRLRLGTVDAGHGGMEMGTFAHRVLEVTHRELLARALERQQPGVSREELLAALEANPACHVPGSRIDDATLEEARAVLELEFDLHQQHMYMERRPHAAQQLLVAHDSAQRAQEDQLKQDLLSAIGYEGRILSGFEPRLFEWSFGRRGQLVEYAGAYFTGTVDRIDVSPHGTAVIIDYKHKSPTGFAAEYDALQEGVLEGTQLPHRVQSLIYAQVVRRAFEGRLKLVGSVYLSTKSPHALAGVADENVVDLVFGKVSKRRLPQVSVPQTPEGTSGMDALLDRTEELVAEQVAQMLAGNVEARPRDKGSCDFCPVMQCEKRMAR